VSVFFAYFVGLNGEEGREAVYDGGHVDEFVVRW